MQPRTVKDPNYIVVRMKRKAHRELKEELLKRHWNWCEFIDEIANQRKKIFALLEQPDPST